MGKALGKVLRFEDETSPPRPDFLSDAAKVEWEYITKELKQLGILSRVDKAALAAYCQAYGRWQEAEEKLKDAPPIVKTIQGNVIQHPWLGIANKAIEQMRSFLDSLGMTPAARKSLGVKKEDEGFGSF
jgi:P27 family predicted phage terminase small subunit